MAQNVKLGRVQLQQMPRLIPAAARRGAGQQPAAYCGELYMEK